MVETKEGTVIDRLERLGFAMAGAKVKELSLKKRKMALAYEHYRFVRPEKIKAFNDKLYKETYKDGSYKTLSFTAIGDYTEVPPSTVLDSLQLAMDRKCFDKYEVAHIREVKDPILFGKIHGCSDLFYIAQWDDDVKIEDILAPNEG